MATRFVRRPRTTLTRWSRCCSPTSALTTSSPRSTRISSDRSGAGPASIWRPMPGSASTPQDRSSRTGRSAGKMATSSGRGVSFIPSIGGAASGRRCSIGSKREPRRCWLASRHRGFATRSMPPIMRLRRCSRTEAFDRSAISGTCRSTSMDRSIRAGPRRHRDRGHRATRRPPGDPRDHRGRLRRRPGRDAEPFDRWAEEHTTGAATTRPSGSWRGTEVSRSVPSPRAPVTMSAGSTTWRSLARIGDAASDRRLLRRAFAMFADRGLERVRLNVDAENVTGATAVYERVGMRVVNRWDLWERRADMKERTGCRSRGSRSGRSIR